MQPLVSEAIGPDRDAADPAALTVQTHRYRSAVLLSARQTAARSGTLMRKHHALSRRLPFFSALIMLTAGRPWVPASA